MYIFTAGLTYVIVKKIGFFVLSKDNKETIESLARVSNSVFFQDSYLFYGNVFTVYIFQI